MARRNLDAAPEPGRRYQTERDIVRGKLQSDKPDPRLNENKPTPTNRVTYQPTNDT